MKTSVWKIFIFFLILGLAADAVLFAGSNSGADFLKIPVGARSLGLGQAYSALAEEADALGWNVAGIVPASLQKGSAAGSLSVSHQELFFGNHLDYLAVAIPRP